MNKKIMALAVAGALAVPGVALAQVTVSGGFRMGVQNHSIANPNQVAGAGAAIAAGALGTATASRVGLHTSEMRVVDNVSQIIFAAREDLGGGLTAVGRYEWRPTIDGAGASAGAAANGTGCATNFVGIESTTMGTLRLGCVNTFAGAGGNGGGFTSDNFLAFTGNVGLMQLAYTGLVPTAAGANNLAAVQLLNFGQGRQANSVTWNSPTFAGGFGVDLVWSSQNAGNDADLASVSNARKGSAYIIGPKYSSGPFSAQYLYFSNKLDGATTLVARDFKSNKVWATYVFNNGISVTGVWSSVSLTNSAPSATVSAVTGGTKMSDANKWMVSGQYLTGPYRFTADYTKSNTDKVLGANTGAKQVAMAMGYAFSKRTDVGLSYTKVTNDSLAAFGPQDTATLSLGGSNDQGQAGEAYTIWGVNLHHKF